MSDRKTLLVADDDYDNFILTMDALREAGLDCELYWVKDGEELMDYLLRRGAYDDPDHSPMPHLILLDLNMPRKTGHEALKEIKAHPTLAEIPVVVLTVSNIKEDMEKSLALGASSHLNKPMSFERLVEFMKVLKKYL
ncbi:MAG TPA: response regulator [Candidatus Eisenbacteria bacterium]|jgi:CheY-like chemotaxis protein|nr:response regulator [Candidatus Eisenbacteria bacterium]